MKDIFFIALFLGSMLFISCHFGTGEGEKIYTPKEFLNIVTINQENYSKDSAGVFSQLRSYLCKHEYSFYNREYFDSTSLIIDTLLYNAEYNKLAIFIILKTPMYRRNELNRKEEYSHWYDAFCYLGIRERDSFNLKWLKRSYLINWYKEDEISSAIRDEYFTEFAAIKDTTGKYTYKYNLNDKRFWNGLVWKEYFLE